MITKRRFFLLTLKLALLVLFLALAAGGGSMAYYHFGNPKITCASCHEMTATHARWTTSAHASAHCRNCHGGSLTLDFHALRSHVNRLVRHFSGSLDRNIRLSESQLLAVHDACRSCHASTFADWQSSRHAITYGNVFLDTAHNKTEQLNPDCLRCHGMFFGGQIEDLVAPLNTQGPWALKDAAKFSQPSIPCLACHQIHAPDNDSGSAQLYVRREQTHFSSAVLPATPIWQGDRAVRVSSDPRQRMCVQCHPPNAFRQLGTSDDRTPAGVHEGLSCLDCHRSHTMSAMNSCGTCHPGSSHCGIDVQKMDTTFRSRLSKHDIHRVACGDCHDGQRPKTAK